MEINKVGVVGFCLGGSIAFVMKGKDVLWSGAGSPQNPKKA